MRTTTPMMLNIGALEEARSAYPLKMTREAAYVRIGVSLHDTNGKNGDNADALFAAHFELPDE